MKTILSIIVAGITLTACPAISGTGGEAISSWRSHNRGYSQTIRDADLKQYPEWEPEQKPCPLPFSKAIQMARAYLRGRFPNVAEWTFQRASLIRISKGKWYYDLAFDDGNPDQRGDTETTNGMNVIVCFNGWIPKIEEDRPKD